jgi:hypothetical protein
MEKKRRFVSTTDEEIEQKRLKMNAQKTIKQNIAAGAATNRCRRKITEGQWAVLNFVSVHYVFSLRTSKKSVKHSSWKKFSYCFKL